MISIFDPIDLTTVPPPSVIETPEFETLRAEILAQFVALQPDYTLLLESDPVVKVVEAWAFRELILRQRINEVAKSNLLPFAIGDDLDNLAAFYNIVRLTLVPAVKDSLGNVTIPAVTESDDALRVRIQEHRSSTAGGAAHYRYQAKAADARVRDAAVYSPDFTHPLNINMGGKVQIAILSTEPGGSPSDDLLGIVRARVSRDDVRVLTDIVEVIPAVQKPFDVVAKLRLYPNIEAGEVDKASTRLTTAFAAIQGLGRDITRSWLISTLNSDRIQSVELVTPNDDVIVAPNEYPVMTSLSTQLAGYSDAEGYGVVELNKLKTQREANQLFVQYAINNKLTVEDFETSLSSIAPAGVISPTIHGLCIYLNLLGIKDGDGNWLPDNELCFLIWRNLSPRYVST